jgi:hypothetical protein
LAELASAQPLRKVSRSRCISISAKISLWISHKAFRGDAGSQLGTGD